MFRGTFFALALVGLANTCPGPAAAVPAGPLASATDSLAQQPPGIVVINDGMPRPDQRESPDRFGLSWDVTLASK